MHVVFRESHGLEETETPTDLGQDPADLVVLSYSDSDLGAFAAGWRRANGALPALRLANLVALRHPLSVDVYLERTLAGAKGILVRLIGGESYWQYGLAQLHDHAWRNGVALAVLPADGRPDPRLEELSTVPRATLHRLSALCDEGGAVAAQAALAQLALAAGLYAPPVPGAKRVPDHGWYDPEAGVLAAAPAAEGPRALVTFYRSYLTASDLSPVDALICALRARGFAAHGLFAGSLKAPASAEWVAGELSRTAPAAIVNATAFSAQGADGAPSPLDAAGCPVFQVALSTNRRSEWAGAERGLSPQDMAMHVVLPEVDGRIFAGVASFKAPEPRDPVLQYSRFAHSADAGRVAAIADRVAAWACLGAQAPGERQLALILSTYPGRSDQAAHAVGLDALASAREIMASLAGTGHDAPPPPDSLGPALLEGALSWPVAAYREALAALPESLRARLDAAWGAPEDDPAVRDGAFRFAALERGRMLIALQPERGEVAAREDDYHDLARTPRHAYVAFYLWLRSRRTDAILHIGAHGTLEWLPGKAVALSAACWPEALTGPMPVIYPFIVNDPGEAAEAKRRTGAATLGHMPPPLVETRLAPHLARLEQLLDEYSTADGLDPRRRERLIGDIRAEARASGVETDLNIPPGAGAAEAIPRIDRFLCDLKESRYGDGLHVFGSGAHGGEERAGLIAALSGRRVAPGPAGSPDRGREDVRPTGRNLFSVDPRAVPTRAAHAEGVRLAEELLRRHLQDEGEWPREVIVDLWSSATMRTAGEEFAMALHLAGARPTWNDGSARVSGFEVMPLAELARPRIAVSLRVSGLFRDSFPTLAEMFDALAAALAGREGETAEDNPWRARAGPAVFAPRPGRFGMAMGDAAHDFTDAGRDAAGAAWLAGAGWAPGQGAEAGAAFAERVRSAAAFVHVQDLGESDILLAADYAAQEGGFAAARARLGAAPAPAWHLDSTRPGRPRAKALTEEIARVVRTRAEDPGWVDGMMRHGFRGAAEITATLDHLAAFANLTRDVPAHLFDLYHDATLGRDDVRDFMEHENPQALAELRARFDALRASGLWQSRRNSLAVPEAGE